jgi:O-antigen/teichoic acid export membrane protein
MNPTRISRKLSLSNLEAVYKTSSGIVAVETLVTTCLSFITFAIIVRVTDLQTVGLWALISSYMAFGRAADFWSRGVSSFVAESLKTELPERALLIVMTSVAGGAIGYGAISLIMWPALMVGLRYVGDDGIQELVISIVPFMCINFWLTSLAAVYQLGFFGFNRPELKARQAIIGSVIFLVFTAMLAPTYGLMGMIIAQVGQAAFMLLYGAHTFHKHVCPERPKRFFDIGILQELIGFGTRSTIVGALQLSTEPLIRSVANYFGGLELVGVIDLASRLCQLPRTLIGALGQPLIPAFSRAAVEGKGTLEALTRNSNSLICPISISSMCAIVGASYLFTTLFLDTTEFEPAMLTTVIALGWLSNLIVSPEYFRLLGARRTKLLIWSHIIMVTGILCFGILGGQLVGPLGSVGGAMIGVVCSSLTLTVFSNSDHKSIFLQKFGRSQIGLLAVTAVVILLQYIGIAIFSGSELIVAVLGAAVIGLAVACLTPWRNLVAVATSIDRLPSADC